jgi:hypothetical protein
MFQVQDYDHQGQGQNSPQFQAPTSSQGRPQNIKRNKHQKFTNKNQPQGQTKVKLPKFLTQKIPSQNPYKCVKCPFTSNYSIDMIKHQKTHSNEINQEFKMLRCGLCEFKTPYNSEEMKRHAQIHQKKVKCEICNYFFFNAESLRAHVEKEHKPFVCEICELKFNQKIMLEKHYNYCHGISI